MLQKCYECIIYLQTHISVHHQYDVKTLQSFRSTMAGLYERRGSVRDSSLNHILLISAQGNNAKNKGASSLLHPALSVALAYRGHTKAGAIRPHRVHNEQVYVTSHLVHVRAVPPLFSCLVTHKALGPKQWTECVIKIFIRWSLYWVITVQEKNPLLVSGVNISKLAGDQEF